MPAAVKQKYPQCVQNGSLVDGPVYQNNGDVMVAGVIYSVEAYKWIRNHRADGDPVGGRPR